MQFFARAGDGHRKVFAALLDAQSRRCRNSGLDFINASAFALAILQRVQAITVQHGISISGIGIESLPNDEASLAMRVATRFGKCDVCSERNVAGNLFPNEMKRVVGEPHVFTAAGYGVAAMRLIEHSRAKQLMKSHGAMNECGAWMN